MASSFQQWESDPLFSAAEVVQDSADRIWEKDHTFRLRYRRFGLRSLIHTIVESIFRLLLHEESLSKTTNTETRLQHPIEYRRRDLVTILETAKWQLEDFEREVNFLAVVDNSQERQNVVYRHRQFVRAIREQIMNVEKSMEKLAVGESARNSEWVDLNEQDRDGLASFLSGGSLIKSGRSQDSEDDDSTLRKFLDPLGSSNITKEITEQKSRRFAHSDPNLDLRDNELRKEDLEIDFEASSAQENSCRHDDWDLEANESKHKAFPKQNNIRGHYSKINPFRSLRNFMPAYVRVGSRSMIKRWKDGEEQRHPRSRGDFFHTIQSYLGLLRLAQRCRNIQFSPQEVLASIKHSCCWARGGMQRYRRSSNNVQGRIHPVAVILAILLTCIVLGILASKIL